VPKSLPGRPLSPARTATGSPRPLGYLSMEKATGEAEVRRNSNKKNHKSQSSEP
jgi:hypothetical protein